MIKKILTALIILTSPALADVELLGNGRGVLVHGTIKKGDSEKLDKILSENPFAQYVTFNSPGGFVHEGWWMAKTIRKYEKRGLFTYVGRGLKCASACTYAFMGGKERRIHKEARVGYHPAHSPSWKDENDLNDIYVAGQQDALGTMMRYSYYVEDGKKWPVLRFIRKAYKESNHDTMYWASHEELYKAGIATQVIEK